jgi:SNF2 family DNA or RNA helicase
MMKCISIPNYKKKGSVFEFTHGSMMYILQNFFGINNITEAKQAAEQKKIPAVAYEIVKAQDETYNITEQLKKAGPVDSNDTFLFKHQQLCRQIALVNKRYGFFLETGTGKTPLSLQIIADDILMNPKNKWLVICPLSLINSAWINDCRRFFPHIGIVNLHGNTPAQTKRAYATPASIYVINFESFKNNYDKLVDFGFEGVIVDESSKMKNPNSDVSKQLLKFSELMNRWYELSGTPAPNSMLEYFAQIKAINPSILGKSYMSYKAKWFYSYSKGGFEAYDILPEKKVELTEVIKQCAIFIEKKDCLDLPEKLDIVRELELPKDLQKQYKQMKDEMYAEIPEKDLTVMAVNAVTSLGKLNQMTSGILLSEDGPLRLSNYKLNELLEVLEEIGDKQAIIWVNYHEEFRMIKEKLGTSAVTYYGDTKADEVVDLCENAYGPGSFQRMKGEGLTVKDIAAKLFKEGKVQYLVANPASAAYGLTFTNASYSIYYGLNYSYEQYAQSRDRIHRYGQKNMCTYIHLLTKGTIDYVLYKCLQDKKELSISVLEHLKPKAIGGED